MLDRAKRNYAAPFWTCLAAIVLFATGLIVLLYQNPRISLLAFEGRLELGAPAVLISHPVGGIVDRIKTADGDWAEVNQILLEFDDTALAAAHKLNEDRWHAATVRLARLRAELAGEESFDLTALQNNIGSSAAIADLFERQAALFRTRAQTRAARTKQLDEQIAYLRNQLATAETEAAASPDPEIIAELEQELTETEARRQQIGTDFRQAIEAEIADLDPLQRDLAAQLETTTRQLDALTVAAPVAGFVRWADGIAEGAVVAADATLAELLPKGAEPVVRFALPARQAAEIDVGQDVEIRHDDQQTPLAGYIRSVGPTTDMKHAVTVALRAPETRLPAGTTVRIVVTTDVTRLLRDLAAPTLAQARPE
ncbi:HlyD family secretion protein [Actibacterium sp. 188UL27-1]|uniref:HlyD family secretion protein n=1 Tax=Actibacterium sp. 188UL27-1 TaxID=2786961 RepID=UPI001956EBE4|nr:HlyD family efflux transporter periplasmic adaptor subunit [Actibacterium sp. 188UL27-1]MBM7067146.1 HlyD family efflux transporter periplasmic adaptor subunit [Actibacterium sp. 188UL27-1]